MSDLYIRVSLTGYVKGWGSKWVAGLSPLERAMVHDGQMVLVKNGVSRRDGIPSYRVVKFYGRYGYCPRVVAPAFKAIADRAIKEAARHNSKLMSGKRCVKNDDIPF
jgi:hypothetical protein